MRLSKTQKKINEVLKKIERSIGAVTTPISRKFFYEKNAFLNQPLPEKPKITFCTTCMGRLHDLKQTLPQNVRDNESYQNLDFVILNYNSPDNMDSWVRENLMGEINSGKIKYYRTLDPLYFNMSHAKNVAHKLAEGDIVCNVDADNFTGKGFAAYLAESFRKNPKMLVRGSFDFHNGTTGRIALPRELFLAVRGYDEKMQGWGYDDWDLIHRIENLRVQTQVIEKRFFTGLIDNTSAERAQYYPKNLQRIESTGKFNKWTSRIRTMCGKITANEDGAWGKVTVFKNFSKTPFVS